MRWALSLTAPLLTALVFSTGCSGDDALQPHTGSLTVITSTAGDTTDPDGYTLQIDGGAPQAIGTSAQIEAGELDAGAHTVMLAGVAGNCSVAEGLTQSIIVDPRVVAVARFTVTCSASGALTVSTETSGNLAAVAGFSFSVDGGASQPIGPNASVTLSGLSTGTHTVTLQDLASGCTVVGGGSQTISISPNATAAVGFRVSCSSSAFQWTSIPLPPGVSASIGVFQGRTIWGTSPSDLFVATRTSGDSPEYGVWHFNGTSWTEQVHRADTLFNAIWGFSGSNVYAVGVRATLGEITRAAAALHFDGSRWSDIELPMPQGEGLFSSATALWGPAPNDVFLVGYSYTGSTATELVAHYDGTSWSRVTTPVFGDLTKFTDLAGISGSDVWTIGSRSSCDDCNHQTAMIVHYDGQTWTEQVAQNADVYTGVWAIAPNDAWVVGGDEDNALVRHYDGATWSRTEPLSTSQNRLQDVWASSATDVYAVGPRVLLHYDGTAWRKISEDGGDRVWGTSPNDIFILRASEILHGHR